MKQFLEIDVAISVVLYQPNDIVLRCVKDNIRKLLEINNIRTAILIHDNSKELAEHHFSEFQSSRYFRYSFSKNVGFGKAHNESMKYFKNAKYYLILNPDIIMTDKVVVEIFHRMEVNNSISVSIPKILNKDGSIQYVNKKLPSPIDLISRRVKSLLKIENVQNDFELRGFYKYRAFRAPFLSGCFLFIRGEHFRWVRGFDSNFFLYLEEIDLCRRLAEFGDTVVFADLEVIHLWNRESYRSLKLFYEHAKSFLYYFNKHGWLLDRMRNKLNNKIGEYDYEN